MRRKRWNRHEIKAEVTRRRSTLTRVATDAGLEPSACRVALCRRNIKGEQALASFLGVEVSVLWPERIPGTTSEEDLTAQGDARTSQNVRQRPDMGVAA